MVLKKQVETPLVSIKDKVNSGKLSDQQLAPVAQWPGGKLPLAGAGSVLEATEMSIIGCRSINHEQERQEHPHDQPLLNVPGTEICAWSHKAAARVTQRNI